VAVEIEAGDRADVVGRQVDERHAAERMALGADARLTAAAALLTLARRDEAQRLLDAEEPLLRERGDRDRLRRLRELRTGRRTAPDAAAHERLADRAFREGHRELALEHYRTARMLREAEPPAAD